MATSPNRTTARTPKTREGITVTPPYDLLFVRETKSFAVFKSPEGGPVIASVYLPKGVWADMGSPARITGTFTK